MCLADIPLPVYIPCLSTPITCPCALQRDRQRVLPLPVAAQRWPRAQQAAARERVPGAGHPGALLRTLAQLQSQDDPGKWPDTVSVGTTEQSGVLGDITRL